MVRSLAALVLALVSSTMAVAQFLADDHERWFGSTEFQALAYPVC